jgi:hypothetical protein
MVRGVWLAGSSTGTGNTQSRPCGSNANSSQLVEGDIDTADLDMCRGLGIDRSGKPYSQQSRLCMPFVSRGGTCSCLGIAFVDTSAIFPASRTSGTTVTCVRL